MAAPESIFNAVASASQPGGRRSMFFWILSVLVFALTLAGAALFQERAGALSSDLAGDPDEAAHAVTGLMVRDYLVHGFGASPLRFADEYYAAFPKVALGHYPPGYYAVAALPMIPAPRLPVLFLVQAVLVAALVLATFWFGHRWVGWSAALAAAGVIVLLPITQKLLMQVMADLLLALVCLGSAAAWAGYLEKPQARRSLGFGLLAALAILTKGSGLMLALVPPLATALTGRWALMKRVDWWLAAVPVAAIAGPWMMFSVRFTQEGMQHVSPWAFLPEAASFYAATLPATIGAVLILSLLLAAIRTVVAWAKGRKPDSREAVLWGMLVGGAAVLLLVPAGTSSRYLMPMIAPMALLAAGCVTSLLAPFTGRRSWVVALVFFVAIAVGVFAPPLKQIEGYGAAVAQALAAAKGTADRPEAWLVSSDARGEGAVIAAAGFGLPQRVPSPLRLLRASKELASSDWMGRGYKRLFESEPALLKHLDDQGVQVVFVDEAIPASARGAHQELLLRALASKPEQWRMQPEQAVVRGPETKGIMKIYRRVHIP